MNKKNALVGCMIVGGLLFASLPAAQAQMEPVFTYQGQLKAAGVPVTGALDMRFSLWTAPDFGLQLGTSFVPPAGVDVVDGLFTVEVDATNFGPIAFDGSARYLQVDVDDGGGWIPLTPRQPVRPAPYALYAADGAGTGADPLWEIDGDDNIFYGDGYVGVGLGAATPPLQHLHVQGNSYVTGNVGIGVDTPSEKLDVDGTAKMTGFQLSTAPASGYVLTSDASGVGTWQAGGGVCLWGENGSDIYFDTGEVGIGTTNPTSPLTVRGNSNSLFYADNTAATGTASGVVVDTASSGGSAIVGRANSSTGFTQGVVGYAYSPDGVAVRGVNGTGTGTALGVHGRTSSTGGVGVFGEATTTTGTASGVWGETGSTSGSGVFGYNGSGAGTATGVLGRTLAGQGVRGEATSTSASNHGVYGETSSVNGIGVEGSAPAGGKGVVGYSGSDNYGYLGWSTGGVYGFSVDDEGVYGRSTNDKGVQGFSETDWGVYGYSPNGSNEAGVVGCIILDNGGSLWKSNSGVSGGCQDGQGVAGRSIEGTGVFGEQTTSGNYGHLGDSIAGVFGNSSNAGDFGVWGRTTGNYSTSNGVYGQATGATYGIGVRGSVSNSNGIGVYGYNGGTGYAGEFYSDQGSAARFIGHDDDCVVIDHDAGITNSAGLVIDTVGSYGEQVGMEVTVDAEFGRLATFDLNGATGYLSSAILVTADNSGNVVEILGEDTTSSEATLRVQSDGDGSAIYGYNSRNNRDDPAVHGYHVSSTSNYGVGVKGEGGYKGVEGRAIGGDGTGTKYGVYGYATNGTTNYAGYFSGNLRCTGTIQKGSGTFMIDHPLDPENKYLFHSFVESPDMMNIYNGNVVLDENGEAVVSMPDWFEVLNMEFRYQLTCIGGFAQVYVAKEIADNQFTIAGGKAGLKVSWQVTGVRQDPFANANRVQVEVDKPEDERGTYLHPEARGKPAELQLDRVREARKEETKVAAAEADAGRTDR